jgi:hypothetical protein
MSYFSFIDQHPTEVPKPQRPVDASEAMTDWIREDRQARHEYVQRNRNVAKKVGGKALAVAATLALGAGLVHEAGGAAGQEEANAAHRAAPIERNIDTTIAHNIAHEAQNK